jgi:hypothetical protein
LDNKTFYLLRIKNYHPFIKEAMDAHIESILKNHHKNITEDAYDLLIDSLYFDEKALMDPAVNTLGKIHEVIADNFPEAIVVQTQQRANEVSQNSYHLNTATALYNIKEAVMAIRLTDLLGRASKLATGSTITERDIRSVIYQEPDLKRASQYTAKSSPHISTASKSALHREISKSIQNVNITPMAVQEIERLITPYYNAIQTIHQEEIFDQWLDHIFRDQRLIDIKYAIQEETEHVAGIWRLDREKQAFIDYLITDLLYLLNREAGAQRRPIIDTDQLKTVLQNYPYLFPLKSDFSSPTISSIPQSKTEKPPVQRRPIISSQITSPLRRPMITSQISSRPSQAIIFPSKK